MISKKLRMAAIAAGMVTIGGVGSANALSCVEPYVPSHDGKSCVMPRIELPPEINIPKWPPGCDPRFCDPPPSNFWDHRFDHKAVSRGLFRKISTRRGLLGVPRIGRLLDHDFNEVDTGSTGASDEAISNDEMERRMRDVEEAERRRRTTRERDTRRVGGPTNSTRDRRPVGDGWR